MTFSKIRMIQMPQHGVPDLANWSSFCGVPCSCLELQRLSWQYSGTQNAAEAIVFPAVRTLVLIAGLVIFQRFISLVYGWVTGQGEAARDSLFAVLVGFALAILALPILAIYWGARETDLLEVWSRLLLGFDVGGVTISPSNFLTFVAIFAIGYTLTRLLQSGLRNSLLPKTSIDPGGQNAIVAGSGYVGVFSGGFGCHHGGWL